MLSGKHQRRIASDASSILVYHPHLEQRVGDHPIKPVCSSSVQRGGAVCVTHILATSRQQEALDELAMPPTNRFLLDGALSDWIRKVDVRSGKNELPCRVFVVEN